MVAWRLGRLPWRQQLRLALARREERKGPFPFALSPKTWVYPLSAGPGCRETVGPGRGLRMRARKGDPGREGLEDAAQTPRIVLVVRWTPGCQL